MTKITNSEERSKTRMYNKWEAIIDRISDTAVKIVAIVALVGMAKYAVSCSAEGCLTIGSVMATVAGIAGYHIAQKKK